MFASIAKAFRRLGAVLGLWIEKSTESDAIDMAVIEKGIRDQKTKADKAHYANGQLATQIVLLKDQVNRQKRQKEELEGMLSAAAAQKNDELGGEYAERLADVESDLNENSAQMQNLDSMYQQNTQIIASSLKEIQKFERDFEATKARVAVSRNMVNLAQLMKGSITELQGMVGGEMSESMNRLRQAAASGEGQMRATMDLAKQMGSNLQVQLDTKKARGKMLFEQYKAKMGMTQPQEAAATEAPAPERQKIAEK
jgi:phage shock protein A